jgi:hypothetical protein
MDDTTQTAYQMGVAFGSFVVGIGIVGLAAAVFALFLQASCWLIDRKRRPDYGTAFGICFVSTLIWGAVGWGLQYVIPSMVGEGTAAALEVRVGTFVLLFLLISACYSSMLDTSYLKAVAIFFLQQVATVVTVVALAVIFPLVIVLYGGGAPRSGPRADPRPSAEVVDHRAPLDVELVSEVLNEFNNLRPAPSYTARPQQGNTARLEAGNRGLPARGSQPAAPNPAPPSTASSAEQPMFPTGPARPALLVELESASVPRIRAAVAQIEKMSPDENQKVINTHLIRLLTSNDLATRHSAARALVTWANDDLVDDLVKGLEHSDRVVRLEMINALAAVKGDTAVQALIGMLKKERDKARDALISIGQPAERLVLGALKNRDTWIRVDACQILGKIGTSDSLKALDNATRDPENVVRRAAIDALRAVRGESVKGKS